MSSDSDSYMWKSSAEIDPYSAQRATAKQQRRLQRASAVLSSLRSSMAASNRVQVPAHLKRPSAASAAAEPVSANAEADTKLALDRQKVRNARAKYM